MRAMKKNESKLILKIREHIITKNLWEYYITDRYKEGSDTQEAYVLGFEHELGDVYLPDLKPFILSRIEVDKNTDLIPAMGYSWA